MTKINQPIVGYSVVTDEEAQPAAARTPTGDTPRPEVLHGSTYKLKSPLTGDHAIYITINDQVGEDGSRRPYELFINSKKNDHFQWVTFMTLAVSAIWRKGGNHSFLVDQMKAIFDPNGGYVRKGGYVPSLVAEIGMVIERHITGEGDMPVEVRGAECPECGELAMAKRDGCETCSSCGHSKCG